MHHAGKVFYLTLKCIIYIIKVKLAVTWILGIIHALLVVAVYFGIRGTLAFAILEVDKELKRELYLVILCIMIRSFRCLSVCFFFSRTSVLQYPNNCT